MQDVLKNAIVYKTLFSYPFAMHYFQRTAGNPFGSLTVNLWLFYYTQVT